MTGHIPGTTVLRGARHVSNTGPGANQVALRATNERVVLSLIRTHGSLSKAQLAELSGLAAQTASVISRSLIDVGLLSAGSPVRGKVGQPYVPLSLNPGGAFFLGVHVGKNETRAALVNFVGEVVSEKLLRVGSPALDQVVQFVRDTAGRIRQESDPDQTPRFQGIGVSIGSGSLLDGNFSISWRDIEKPFEQVGKSLGLTVNVASDALAACSAELTYGIGASVSDFLYVFLDDAVGGGLVLDRRIRFSEDESGPNIAKLLVPNGKTRLVPLRSLVVGGDASVNSINELADGIACAVANCAAMMPCRTVIVDGHLPDHTLRLLMARLRSAIARLNFPDVSEISAREGSMSRKTIAMGAACLPLIDRYYPTE